MNDPEKTTLFYKDNESVVVLYTGNGTSQRWTRIYVSNSRLVEMSSTESTVRDIREGRNGWRAFPLSELRQAMQAVIDNEG